MEHMKLNETSLLGASKKSYGRSYGTTSRSLQETYIKHTVSPDDTLQGIALKYGVTVEQIKRANKLYTNDTIFLRTTLSIPVGDQPLPASVLEGATASASDRPIHGALQTSIIPENSSSDEDNAAEPFAEEQPVKETKNNHEEKRDLTMDFFNRIDRELRQEKSKTVQIASKSQISEIEDMVPETVSQFKSSAAASQDASRRASTGQMARNNSSSYQHGTVRHSMQIDRRRSVDVVAMPNFSGKGVLRTPVWAE